MTATPRCWFNWKMLSILSIVSIYFQKEKSSKILSLLVISWNGSKRARIYMCHCLLSLPLNLLLSALTRCLPVMTRLNSRCKFLSSVREPRHPIFPINVHLRMTELGGSRHCWCVPWDAVSTKQNGRQTQQKVGFCRFRFPRQILVHARFRLQCDNLR